MLEVKMEVLVKLKDNVDLKELENILTEREQDKARIKEEAIRKLKEKREYFRRKNK